MSVNIQLENKLKTIAGGKLTARQVTQALGYTPANASSVTNIIDVNELPTENINSRALYRITEDIYKVSTIDSSHQIMQLNATRLKVIVVSVLPETGEDFNDFVVYYNTTEDNVYLYTEQTWFTSTAAGYPYLGCVSTYEEMTDTEGLYLIYEKQYSLYEYTDGRFVKILTEGDEKPPVIFRAIENPEKDHMTNNCCYFTPEDFDIISNNDDVIIRLRIPNYAYVDFKRIGNSFQAISTIFGTRLLTLYISQSGDMYVGKLLDQPIFNDLDIEINDQNQLELYHWPDLKETIATMNLDTTPTENSQRLVLSSGVYTELEKKAPSIHDHSNVTTSTAGFMSASDKTKLDGININNLVTLDQEQCINGVSGINLDSIINIGSTGAYIEHTGTGIDIYDPTQIAYKSPLHKFEGNIDFSRATITKILMGGTSIESTPSGSLHIENLEDGISLAGNTMSISSDTGDIAKISLGEGQLMIEADNGATFYPVTTFEGNATFKDGVSIYGSHSYLYSNQSITIENEDANGDYSASLSLRDGQDLSADATTINIHSENNDGDIASLTFKDGELTIHADGNGARFDSTTATTFEGDATFKGTVDFSNATIAKIPMSELGNSYIEYQMSTTTNKEYLYINNPNLSLYSPQSISIENDNDGEVAGLYLTDGQDLSASANTISIRSDDSETGDLSQLYFNGGKLRAYADTEVVYQSPSHKFKGAVDFSEATVTGLPAESNNTILTSAPTAENTTGTMKFVVLASEPATRYNGYLYIITG